MCGIVGFYEENRDYKGEEVLKDMADFTNRLGAAGEVSCNVARIVLDPS